MDEHGDELTQARRAHVAEDWRMAATAFDSVPIGQLSADDMQAYFEALWWVGRYDEMVRVGPDAFEALLADSRPVEAVRLAVWHGLRLIGTGDEPQAIGWIGRIGRVLEQIPENAAHGHFLWLTEVFMNLVTDHPKAAVDAAHRVQELGRQFDDPDLVAGGLYGEGHGLIKLGEVVDGLARLDEGMVGVLAGRVDSKVSGLLYCLTIGAFHEVADLRRMSRWTELCERWLTFQSAAVWYDGVCRIYRAELQLKAGEWDEAESGAHRVAAELDGNTPSYSAEAWYLVGEVRRLRGDPTAVQAYDEAHARGRDPQPGRALLLLQQGDAATAATSVRVAIAAAGDDPLRRAPICAAAVDIAIAVGRLDEAAAAESELAATAATYATSGLEAMAATARGSLLLAKDRPGAALPVLREAYQRWLGLGAQHDTAATSLRLADTYRALGDDVSADAEQSRAKEIYERLGVQNTGPEPPDGLTRRECEVLGLLADGRSNRDIGEELYISHRTVGRHLTNIYHKIGVTNRTEAARYAVDHGIAFR